MVGVGEGFSILAQLRRQGWLGVAPKAVAGVRKTDDLPLSLGAGGLGDEAQKAVGTVGGVPQAVNKNRAIVAVEGLLGLVIRIGLKLLHRLIIGLSGGLGGGEQRQA